MIPIAKPARSAYADAPPAVRDFVDRIVAILAGQANWMVRKKTLVEALSALASHTRLSPTMRRELEEKLAEETLPEEELAEKGNGMETTVPMLPLIPVFTGAILERLDEPAITSAEQAVLYILSIHPEHQAAAQAWGEASPGNLKAARGISRSDTRLRPLLRRIDDARKG